MITGLAEPRNSIASKLPYLWTEDYVAAQALSQYFRIALPGDDGEGEHIIALQSEPQVRKLARHLQKAGGRVCVFKCPSPLAVSIFAMGVNVAPMIVMGAIPYDQWLKSIKNEPLDLEDAVAITKDILINDPDSIERTIALDVLGRRAGMNQYNWDKKYLDAIRAELEKAIALPHAPESLDPTERKRLELQALSSEHDPDKLTDGIIAFCRRYGWSRKDVEQRLRQLKSTTTTPKAKRLVGKDFLTLETESISWVFPGIIPSRGVFVVGGHAGVGKTTFAYDAVGSLLLGEQFLGEKPVKTGKVLLVTGDELPCFTQDKLIERGIPSDNENWEIILNWDVSQWDVLEEALSDIRPALVVIDSFSSIHRDPSFDENSAQAKSTIYDLEALTNAYNCGCILIHHLSKSKDNRGVAKLRGSSAIAAAASVVCLMEQVSDTTRQLTFPKVRGAQTEPFLISLDGPTGRYQVVNGGDASETKSLGERILAFLHKSPHQRFEQDEISKALGIPLSNKDSVYQALGRLFKRGLIIKRPSLLGGKRKVYGIANPYVHCDNNTRDDISLTNVIDNPQDTPPPSPLNLSVQISENIDKYELELTDSLTDNVSDAQLTLPSDVQAASSSNQELEGISVELTDTVPQGGVSPLLAETVTDDAEDLAIASAPLVDSQEIAQSEPVIEAIAPAADAFPMPDEQTIMDVAELLEACDSKELLQEICLLPEITPALLNQACKCLSQQKHAEIQAWLEPSSLQIGDRVIWSECPAHCSKFSPFEIMEIHGDLAKLDLFANLVPLAELDRCER